MTSAAQRILGIDPGLTRCGFGIIDVAPNRQLTLVTVGVLRTPADAPPEQRLRAIADGVQDLMDRYAPGVLAIERVFAQHNRSTVMGIAQLSGALLVQAARQDLAVAMHTPSEVKAAVSGYGAADKQQVAAMVARLLRLPEPPKPADAADALALAITHAWRGGASAAAGAAHLPHHDTPALRAWRAAAQAASSRRSRLGA